MARTRSAKASRAAPADEGASARPWGEFLGVALLALSVLTVGGLISYQGGDGLLMGPVGQLVAAALYAVLGMASYILALGIAGLGLKALLGREVELEIGEALGFTAATVAGCALLHVTFPAYRLAGATSGGLLGELVGELALGLFGVVGTYLVAIALLCVGLIASTPLSARHLVIAARAALRGTLAAVNYLWGLGVGVVELLRNPPRREEAADEDEEEEVDEEDEYEEEEDEEDAYEEEAEEDEEDEEEEAEEEAEEEEEAVIDGDEAEEDGSVVIRPRRGRRASQARAKKAPARGAPEIALPEPAAAAAGEEAAAGADEAAGEAAAGDKPRRNRKRKQPEIVLADPAPEPAARAPAPAPAPEDEVEVEDEVALAPPASPRDEQPRRGKKPPPRPQELAQGPTIHMPDEGADEAGEAARVDDDADADADADDEAAADEAAAPAPARPPAERVKPIPGIVRLTPGPYQLPPSKLFEVAISAGAVDVDKGFVLEQAEKIEQALAQFKIRGQVTKIHPGPVITRYEFKPEPGVKLSKIESLENDLAMALEAIRIRILAPIPGKATVGFEVPNKVRETVALKEILESDYFASGRAAKLPMALGKNITGKAVSIDLAKAPHLLVAGATGSGKSVGVNSMICSLLYACTPEDVRMIMIDPKMLELSIYKDIPHLLLPVITDPEQANLALRWAVDEMERRYAVLSDAQVRDIGGYNRKLPQLISEWEAEKRALEQASEEARRDAAENGEDGALASQLPGISFDSQGNQLSFFGVESQLGDRPEKLPYIVVIIDEFADLMMVASKEVEASVARIAAKARAAGIHLIVATQRPSVDVITGTIKNNFPSRIAFQVTSDIDSRTILDCKGAKQLLGMGDMLHMDRGSQPERVHGCFVSEDEILKVVEFIKKQARPVYNRSITAKRDEEGNVEEPERRADPLYDKAVQIVAETRKVSTSMIQRRLNVGYNRAAKMVEMMEEEGVIGPARGTAPREVLISAA